MQLHKSLCSRCYVHPYSAGNNQLQIKHYSLSTTFLHFSTCRNHTQCYPIYNTAMLFYRIYLIILSFLPYLFHYLIISLLFFFGLLFFAAGMAIHNFILLIHLLLIANIYIGFIVYIHYYNIFMHPSQCKVYSPSMDGQ